MFLLFALQQTQPNHFLRRASSDVQLDASMDELPEIEQGLQELAESARFSGRQGAYWQKIRAKVLSCSSTQDVDEALKEWDRDGNAWSSPGGTCELCGRHPIRFQYPIKNRVTGDRLIVGSECIKNYLDIPGFGDVEELQRRLNGERTRLKQLAKGQITESEFSEHQEAIQLEVLLRRRIAALAGSDPDFIFPTYRDELFQVDRVLIAVSPQSPVRKDIDSLLKTLSSLTTIYGELSKRSAKLKTFGLLAMAGTAMRLRDASAKTAYLKRIQAAMGDLTKPGTPTDFIKRCWETVKSEKMSLMERLDASVDAQRQLIKKHEDFLDKLKPYEFLHFSILAGLSTARKLVEDEANRAKEVVMDDDFLDVIVKPNNPVSLVLSYNKTDPMLRLSHVVIQQAIVFEDALRSIEWMGTDRLVDAILVKYRLSGRIRDRIGVQVACLRALDDSLVDIDGSDRRFVEKLLTLFQQENPKFLAILQQEVDDIKALRKKELWEMLSTRWDFDVQKAFKVFRRDGKFEQDFCESLLKNWYRWETLSSKQMAIVQRQLAQRDRVEDNMWDALKSELTKPAPRM